MHTTLETNTLKENLELVAQVSTKHATLPVLQCVLIETKKDAIILRTTNLEVGVEVKLVGKIEEEGVIAVPATTLIQTINLHTEPNITLRTEEDTLMVEGKDSQTQIKGIAHDEFPTIPHLKQDGQTFSGKLFGLGIKTVAFAASQSSIKPELGSVYIFQKKEHTLTFVTTDSFRLMEKTLPQKGVVLEESILIPHKNALDIARVCEGQSEDPICRITENQLSLEFPNGVYITSRLTNGSFPDYEQIIPKEYVTHSTILKNDLAHAFKKTNIFLNKFFQVSLHVTKDSVTVASNSGDVGATTESIKATTEGDDLTLNFNQRYLYEPLSHVNDESLIMHFAGIGRPVVMQGVTDNTLRYLVMPMNK